jgi:hypothetical protein
VKNYSPQNQKIVFFFDPIYGAEITVPRPLSDPPENLPKETPLPNIHHIWTDVDSPDSEGIEI